MCICKASRAVMLRSQIGSRTLVKAITEMSWGLTLASASACCTRRTAQSWWCSAVSRGRKPWPGGAMKLQPGCRPPSRVNCVAELLENRTSRAAACGPLSCSRVARVAQYFAIFPNNSHPNLVGRALDAQRNQHGGGSLQQPSAAAAFAGRVSGSTNGQLESHRQDFLRLLRGVTAAAQRPTCGCHLCALQPAPTLLLACDPGREQDDFASAVCSA